MAKKKSNWYKPPVRLKSQKKHTHQGYFLYYINELAPEVSDELKKLTSSCEKLFGKFPLSDHTKNDYKNFYVWLDAPGDDVNQHQFWRKFSNIFRKCIWKESRARELSEFWEYLSENIDENYDKQINLLVSKIETLVQFQNDFDKLLEKYWLEKKWLAESVFRAIWNGTGKLQMEASFIEKISKELVSEVEERLELPKNEDTSEQLFREWLGDFPPPKSFIYNNGFEIYCSFEDYEEKAVEAYRQHLQNYFTVIKESLGKFGYRNTQGYSYDYERVKWLVWWNIERLSKDDILTRIEEETRVKQEDIGKDEPEGKQYDLSTINTAFRIFQNKYGLPLRRATRNRK